jgi:hypothetical protein
VFKNEKGQFYKKDKNGNIILLSAKEAGQVHTESKTIQVV